MLRIAAHVAGIHLFLAQSVLHKAAKRIVADAADKPAVATQAGDTYRHIGRRAAGTLQQATAAFRQQIHYRIPKHPYFCIHTVSTSMLNLIKPV